MANYATLIAAIQSVITQNGNNEITGPILQQTLISVVNSLGSGYQFIGIATPETTPGTPDQKVFYIGASGTYPNFGPAVIPDGNLAVFYYDSSWHYGSVAFPLGDGAVSTSKIQDGAVTELKLATSLIQKLLNDGFVYAGIATTNTNPGTPTKDCFYFAQQVGTYSNFGLSVSAGELAVFKYSNSSWTKDVINIPISVLNGSAFPTVTLNIVNNVVRLELSSSYLTLDSIAYENLTYRQLFETNNSLGISPGFENGSYSPLIVGAGSPVLTTEIKDSGNYSLKCAPTGSSYYLRTSGTYNKKGFFACRVKVTSYTAGEAGIQYNGVTAGLSGVSDWVTKVGYRDNTSPNSAVFIGSFTNANLTCYVDTPVFVQSSVFTTIPSTSTFQELFDIYVRLKKGEAIPASADTIYLVTQQQPGEKYVKDLTTGGISLDVTGSDVKLNVNDTGLDLDSVAYENLTYRQIFETNNLLGISPGFENGSYSPLQVASTNAPTVQSSVKDSGNYALMASGSASQNIRTASTYPASAFQACRVKITSYTSGYCGIQYGVGTGGAASGITDWVTKVATRGTGNNNAVFIGSWGSGDPANLTGYIDTPVVVLYSVFSTTPSLAKFTELYNNYCAIKRGETLPGERTLHLQVKETPIVYTDEACRAAFVEEMNKYAARYGMTNTHFDNPHGLPTTDTHLSCARDLAKMGMCCTGYKKLMEFWGQLSYSVQVGGPHARTISGNSTYKGEAMYTVGNYYHIYGGKSGSLTWHGSRYENLILVCKSKIDDAWLAGCIMYNTNIVSGNPTYARGVPFKQMLDWLEDYRQDPTTAAQTVQAQYCSAFVVPPHNPMAYQDVVLEMVGKSSTTQAMPASTTKLMTAMVALDYLDLNEIITIKTSDIEDGSGDTFYNGDTLNVADAMVAFLLPSSNTLGSAFARVVGEKILKIKG